MSKPLIIPDVMTEEAVAEEWSLVVLIDNPDVLTWPWLEDQAFDADCHAARELLNSTL